LQENVEENTAYGSLVRGFMGKCFHSNTEILTKFGWKKVSDIKIGELVCSFDPVSKKIEYVKCTKTFQYDFNGDLLHIHGRSIEQIITPNHNLIIERNRKIQFIKADSLPQHFKMINQGIWEGKNLKNIFINDKLFHTKDFLLFLGLFLGDGCTVNRKKHKYKQDFMTFGIKKKRKIKIIRKTLSNLHIKFTENISKNKYHHFYIYDKKLLEYLKPLGKAKTKYIPQELFDLDSKLLEYLYRGMIITDGTTQGYNNQHIYFTASEKLADDFQRLCLHTGRSCIKTKKLNNSKNSFSNGKGYLYTLSITQSNKKFWLEKIDHKTKKIIVKKLHHNGKVCCVELEKNHILLSRYNGKTVWSGNSWDVLPSIEILKECCRVLKAGAFSFWLMTPRQDSLAEFIFRLKKAGFDVNFTSLWWCYFSGFPKSMSISLAIDKRECRKQLKEKLGREPTKEEFESEWKNFREIIGQKKGQGNIPNIRGEWGLKSNMPVDITIPVTKEAKALDGSFAGLQLKPAVECIVVAMKQLSEKSYTEQALKNRKGVTWLQDCHIPYQNEIPNVGGRPKHGRGEGYGFKPLGDEAEANPQGRFPANIIVSGDALNDGTISKGQQGATTGEEPSTQKRANVYGDYTGFGKQTEPRGDEGSYSRYFSLDAWWKEQIKKLPSEVQRIFPFLIVPKASKSERNEGLQDLPEQKMTYDSTTRTNKETADKFGCERKSFMQNIHPSVKPVELMSYLITLGSRQNDIVLDPFAGSGTTAVACRILNRKSINFEKVKEYCEIAENRLKPFLEQKKFTEFQN
jgi:hypothetical protein